MSTIIKVQDAGLKPMGEDSAKDQSKKYLARGSFFARFDHMFWRLVAECLGTMTIVVIGCGSVASGVLLGSYQGTWQVAIMWGLGVALGVYFTAPISGGHLNPAISLTMAVFRKNEFNYQMMFRYWCAQLLGGILGGLINLAIYYKAIEEFEEEHNIHRGDAESVLTAVVFGAYFPNPGVVYGLPNLTYENLKPITIKSDFVGPAGAFFIEAWATGILMFAILCLTDKRNKTTSQSGEYVPYLIGMTVAALTNIYAPFTTAAWNPARDLGPRLVASAAGWGMEMPTVPIAGHSVEFPFDPYGVQKVYMEKVLKALQSGTSALLESPTGTGKTLSLLCSSLAWQSRVRLHPSSVQIQPTQAQDDRSATAETPPKRPRYVQIEFETTMDGPDIPLPSDKANVVPKIIYATRTHSQITQVIRELKSTSYRPVMSVLSGRDQSCIHRSVQKSSKKTEDCKQLLADNQCYFYIQADRLAANIRPGQIWDIEEFVQLGKKTKGCPFFAAKSIAEDSDIIFCPYNYILEPNIRLNLGFSLNGAVLIFDEAHNIEDVARDAASFVGKVPELKDALSQMERLTSSSERNQKYTPVNRVMRALITWIESEGVTGLQMKDNECRFRVFDENRIALFFEEIFLDQLSFPSIKILADDMCEVSASAKKGDIRISSYAAGVLSGMFTVFEFIFQNNMQSLKDYRMIVEQFAIESPISAEGSWLTHWSLICLNPAVAFRPIKSIVRSIVLTSGTLSPIDSFASELGIEFKHILEASHVIDMEKQVLATYVPIGPKDVSMNCTYKTMQSFDFQDSLGTSLLDYCSIIPNGVLCFFPSYTAMYDFKRRWTSTGTWDRLTSLKTIVEEPRKSDKEFTTGMTKFYEAVQKSKVSGKGGGLYLAVFRGKVSEGIDFSDDNARGVILVGIPFPNVRDITVDLKKKYNNIASRERTLLDGERWYQLQAFRALNQAIGRCIRHRQDYGAVIFLDDRFQRGDYIARLSKWIRGNLRRLRYDDSKIKLQEFFARRAALTPTLPATSSNVPTDIPGAGPSGTTETPTIIVVDQDEGSTSNSHDDVIFVNSPSAISNGGQIIETLSHAPEAQKDTEVIDPLMLEGLYTAEDLDALSLDIASQRPVDVQEQTPIPSASIACRMCSHSLGSIAGPMLSEKPEGVMQSILRYITPALYERHPQDYKCSVHISTYADTLNLQTVCPPDPPMILGRPLWCGSRFEDSIWIPQMCMAYRSVGCPSCRALLGLQILATSTQMSSYTGQLIIVSEAIIFLDNQRPTTDSSEFGSSRNTGHNSMVNTSTHENPESNAASVHRDESIPSNVGGVADLQPQNPPINRASSWLQAVSRMRQKQSRSFESE